jgi:hypothetical protein
MQGDTAPTKMFDRSANLTGNQIIAYRASEDMQWFTLNGIAPGRVRDAKFASADTFAQLRLPTHRRSDITAV